MPDVIDPVVEYLSTALALQNKLMYKLVQHFGEELFPKNAGKIIELHNLVRETLEEIHKQAAEHAKIKVSSLEDSKNTLEPPTQN